MTDSSALTTFLNDLVASKPRGEETPGFSEVQVSVLDDNAKSQGGVFRRGSEPRYKAPPIPSSSSSSRMSRRWSGSNASPTSMPKMPKREGNEGQINSDEDRRWR
eukprot:Nitzschia sp. Nitz4//NODE_367_length_23738_cov_71.755985//21683//21997//NITZ4_additional_000046-RA//1//CDS//3329531861//9396//frame0